MTDENPDLSPEGVERLADELHAIGCCLEDDAWASDSECAFKAAATLRALSAERGKLSRDWDALRDAHDKAVAERDTIRREAREAALREAEAACEQWWEGDDRDTPQDRVRALSQRRPAKG